MPRRVFLFYFMQIIFDDNNLHHALAPLTLTKPVSQLRFGIQTVEESWLALFEKQFNEITKTYNTEAYLNVKYPQGSATNDTITISGNIKPTKSLFQQVITLKEGEALYSNGERIALKGKQELKKIVLSKTITFPHFNKVWELFQHNDTALKVDFEIITEHRQSNKLNDTNKVSAPNEIFVEEGAQVNHAILNASTGPIYIGKDAEIMEGSIIRGPFAIGEHATVKMGAKIYGATTVGPHCKVGGEISNSIFQAYSNKGHDGFMGNSVIGEWCNFGADTNTSNLKNNYSNVKIYDFGKKQMVLSPILFCGTIMGDHSKTGINTMLNTATVVGVSANIFGGGFPPKYIPSFAWGGVENTDKFIIEKAFEVAKNMMARRKIELSDADQSILTHLYNLA